MKDSCASRDCAPSDRCAIGDRQAVVAFAEARQQHAAAGDAAGQRMVGDFQRLELAEQAVGAGGDAAHAPVGLVAPVIEATAFGQVMGLVGEAGAPAAGIAFLQADDVVAAGEFGDGVERAALVARRQHVRPAARRVVAVATRAGAGLDVGAEQLEALVRHRLGRAGGRGGAYWPAARSCAIRVVGDAAACSRSWCPSPGTCRR